MGTCLEIQLIAFMIYLLLWWCSSGAEFSSSRSLYVLHVKKSISKSSILFFFNGTGAVPQKYFSVIPLITSQTSENHISCVLSGDQMI